VQGVAMQVYNLSAVGSISKVEDLVLMGIGLLLGGLLMIRDLDDLRLGIPSPPRGLACLFWASPVPGPGSWIQGNRMLSF
jgi:hypothetical protein